MRCAGWLLAGLALLMTPGRIGAENLSDAGGIEVISAQYADPTTRYDHGVLGDAVEWGSLLIRVDTCAGCASPEMEERRFTLPDLRVFEDTVPRVVALPARAEKVVIVVEAHIDQGARLAVYDGTGLRAATPYIGRSHRWLAPVGAMDIDGDGALEIAYIDRPHLAKTLRIWRFEDDRLTEIASLPGFTNHRIGEPDIAGGIRACAPNPPEMIVATADWSRLVAIRFDGARFAVGDIGPHRGRDSFATALTC